MTTKQPQHIVREAPRHWVGDGFPVRTIFSYDDLARELSPFLLLDHAGPAEFPADGARRGVGWHPHRGFETVTVIYAGDVEHRDSHGGGGTIGPGDVQWMTAASGLVHEEMHGPRMRREGGLLEMVQLWVNLPAARKRERPGYQAIEAASIPEVDLEGGAGRVRVIAGTFGATTGPARTFTPVVLWDVRLRSGGRWVLPVADGHSLGLFVLRGGVTLEGGATLGAGELAVYGRAGEGAAVEAREETTAIVLGGEPIHEPIVAHGPFVMNTRQEILEAIDDFRSGRMGTPPDGAGGGAAGGGT